MDGLQVTPPNDIENQGIEFLEFVFQSFRYCSVLNPWTKQLELAEIFPNVYHKEPTVYGITSLILIVNNSRKSTGNINRNTREYFRNDHIIFNAAADEMVKDVLKRVCAMIILQQPIPSGQTIDGITSLILTN